MGAADIAFPHLRIYLENVPKSFNVLGFSISYYGAIIAAGILAGLCLAVYDAKRTGQNPDVYWDFALYVVVFSVIGARLYYVFFSWDYYKNHLGEIFHLRSGGMAIYGAVIAAFLTLFIYCRIKKYNPFQIADTGVLGLLLGQIIGRFGNFMNREAFGGYTDGLFAMRLPVEAVRRSDITEEMWEHVVDGANYIQVHPTFLYESAWNLALLLLLLCYRKRKAFQGEVCLLYLGGYGLGRFLIEGLRTDKLLIPGTGIAVSGLLSLVLFLLTVTVDIICHVSAKRVSVYPSTTSSVSTPAEDGKGE